MHPVSPPNAAVEAVRDAPARFTRRLSELSLKPWFAKALWAATAASLLLFHLFKYLAAQDFDELDLDESGTWGVAAKPLGRVLTLPTEFHSQPQLYYLVLKALIQVSDSVWFMRSFSLLCTLLLLVFVLFFVHELSLLARAFFSVLFTESYLTRYLAHKVRPYGLSSVLTLVSCVTFLRLFDQPTNRRLVIYVTATLAMAYTMAFNVAVLAVQGLMFGGVVISDLLTTGLRSTWLRRRRLLIALLIVAVGYLPYLFLVIHYQYQPNPRRALDLAFRVATYETALRLQMGLAPAILSTVAALAALGLLGQLFARSKSALFWGALVIGSIGFVHEFIIGRSVIGAQLKYMTPAFLAYCLLAAYGVHHLVRRTSEFTWPVLFGAVCASMLWPSWKAFAVHEKKRAAKQLPLQSLAAFREQLLRHPGKKVVFVDTGYDGQRLEYLIRNDKDIETATDKGTGWASGGNGPLETAYVSKTVAALAPHTTCFFYVVYRPHGAYTDAFLPGVKKLGFQERPPLSAWLGLRADAYCRP